MGQIGSHSTDFRGIVYMNIFPKYVEKIQIYLKSDKNDGQST